MFKRICVVILILFILGCGSIKNTKTVIPNAGGYENDLSTGLSFYHQYISTSFRTKKGKVISSKDVFNYEKKDVPHNLVNLNLSLLVKNPYSVEFHVVENLELVNLETNKAYFKHKKLRDKSQLLPEELFSIGLPLMLDAYSQVIFSVDVVDKSGEAIYSTYEVVYNTYQYKNRK